MGVSGGGRPPYMEHLIGAYTFGGRSNADADRNTLYDISGHENNLTVKSNFEWGKEVDSYTLGFVDDAFIFSQSSVATTLFKELINGWTFIFDRDILKEYRDGYTSLMWCGSTTPIYICMDFYNGTDNLLYRNGFGNTAYKLYKAPSSTRISWMSLDFADGEQMAAETNFVIPNRFNLGSFSGTRLIRLRALYIFNTNLTPEEVEDFVKKNIDATL